MKKYQIWGYATSVVLMLVHILPFYILLTSSMKMNADLSSKWLLPDYLYWENFSNAWTKANLLNAFINTAMVTGISLCLLVLIGSLSSYPLSRYPSRWNQLMYTFFVSVMVVPPLAILVPLYQFYVDIGATNTYWGMILLHTTFFLPVTIFLYTGFISSIPRELDEAGMIDGASKIGIFIRLILPLLKPVTSTVLIITGIQIWNDYQFSIFFLQKTEVQTFTVALSAFFGQYNSNIGWVAAGSLIATIPLAVLYLFLQKYFVRGLSSGAVKG